MWWVALPAWAVGAPMKRSRWFCLCVRRDAKIKNLKLMPSETYSRFNWSKENAPRMTPTGSSSNRRRMRMLGNTVVPDCVRAAFMSLWTGCTLSLTEALRRSGRVGAPPIYLTPPKPLGPLLNTQSYSYACVIGPGKPDTWQRIARPSGMQKPNFNLVFDSNAYKAPNDHVFKDTTPRVLKPVHKPLWGTPRASNGSLGSHVLTTRGLTDLGTQIRFEKSTAESARGGHTNPDFVEWLMGFPKKWTSTST